MDLVDTPKLFLLSSYFTTQFNAAMHSSQMCVLQCCKYIKTLTL